MIAYGVYIDVHMSYSLDSLKGVYIRIISGSIIRVTKGDTRSLHYSSYLKEKAIAHVFRSMDRRHQIPNQD